MKFDMYIYLTLKMLDREDIGNWGGGSVSEGRSYSNPPRAIMVACETKIEHMSTSVLNAQAK